MKSEAFVMRDPLGPITLSVRDHLVDMRRTTPTYGDGLTPGEVVARVGGLAAFPAYEVSQTLTCYVLRQPAVKAKRGDLADEYIASYAPYAAVTALDRGTAHRLREAKLSCAGRVTSRLKDVPALLARVRAGELEPAAAARMPDA